jgi:hypothetical protein
MTWDLWAFLGFIVILVLYIAVRQWLVHNIASGKWDSDSEK